MSQHINFGRPRVLYIQVRSGRDDIGREPSMLKAAVAVTGNVARGNTPLQMAPRWLRVRNGRPNHINGRLSFISCIRGVSWHTRYFLFRQFARPGLWENSGLTRPPNLLKSGLDVKHGLTTVFTGWLDHPNSLSSHVVCKP